MTRSVPAGLGPLVRGSALAVVEIFHGPAIEQSLTDGQQNVGVTPLRDTPTSDRVLG